MKFTVDMGLWSPYPIIAEHIIINAVANANRRKRLLPDRGGVRVAIDFVSDARAEFSVEMQLEMLR